MDSRYVFRLSRKISADNGSNLDSSNEATANVQTKTFEAGEIDNDIGDYASIWNRDSWRSSRYFSFISNRTSVRTFLTARSRQTAAGRDSTISYSEEVR
jgi:hypothetical protein